MTKDSVAIVLPMWFTGGQDTAIGTAFLQELATARQSSALRMSPACSHHAGDRPPPELRGVKLLPRRSSCASVTAGGGGASSARSSRASDDAARPPPLTAAQLLQPNGGYVTFTFQPRHVSGPQIDAIVWSMLSFSYFVSFQIAASKVMLHSRLRSELTAMVDRLNESKMASSYTIRQQLGSPATSPPGTSPSTSSFSAAAVAAAAPVTAVLAPERSVASVASAAVSGSANLVAMAEFTGLTLEERMASMTGAEMAAAATVGAAAPPLRPANASSTGASRATAAITEQQQAAAPYVAAPEAVILTSAAEVVPRPATPTHPPSAGGGGHEAGPASAGRSGPKSILQHYRNFSARFSPAKSPAAAAGSSGSSPLNSTPGKSPKSGGKDRTSRRLEPRFGCF